MNKMTTSRISGFHTKSLEDRIRIVREFADLTNTEAEELRNGLPIVVADKMIECVTGVYGLPFAIVPNLRMNRRDFLIPLVVEEPSIVSGLAFAGKVSREGEGIYCEYEGSHMIGQVLLRQVIDPKEAIKKIHARKEDIIEKANALEERSTILKTGGGVQQLEAYMIDEKLVGIDFNIDVKDAHGANFITRMMEGIVPYLETITGATRGLAILSNFCPQRIVSAEMYIPVDKLARKKGRAAMSGEEVAHAIEDASKYAKHNMHRAVTHNKGISNGIGALLAATGNDWRAQEAGAHAYAARHQKYEPWSDWNVTHEKGKIYLRGSLEMPVQVGTVGGITGSHPLVRIALKIIGKAAGEERASTPTLSKLCGAVGLAQNFAALYTLSTTGLIEGHVWKHGRNYCLAAGIPPASVDDAVKRMIQDEDVSDRHAREIAHAYR